MNCRYINLIAACACLVTGIFFTVMNQPIMTIAVLVAVGVANVAFILAT